MAATLYEALSGSRAFPGEDTVHVAARITGEPVTPIARACNLNSAVDDVLGRAFEKTGSARYPTAREFGQALGEALEERARSPLPTLPDEYHREYSARKTRSVAVGSAAVGALLAVALFELTTRFRHDEAATATATVARAAPPPTVIKGWLAPSARPRPRPRPSAPAKERAIFDGGAPQAEASSERPAPSASSSPEPVPP
jgi:serine/threonine-protein kinase